MLRRLIHTGDDLTPLLVRVALALVMFPHGAQKVFGWFGGYGVRATVDSLVGLGIPTFFAYLAIIAESAGSLGLAVGFLTRVAAFGILCNMVVAVVLVHQPYGFFMNWSGQQKGEGFEFHILAIAMAAALMIRGGGALSIDRALTRNRHP